MREDRLDKINKKKQFIISQIGQSEYERVMTALDEIVKSNLQLIPLLVDITEYYRLEARLPLERQ